MKQRPSFTSRFATVLLAAGGAGCGGQDPVPATQGSVDGMGGATGAASSVGGASSAAMTSMGGASTTVTSTTTTLDTTGAAGSTTTSTVSTTSLSTDSTTSTTSTTGTTTGGTGGTGGGGNVNNGDSSRVDGLPETTCTVTVLGSDIAQIQTVGVVTFSTDFPGVSIAEVQFGPDASYGMVAPVDLGAQDYRTLLLGMTQNATYNYRIAVSDGSQVCYSENQTIQTGSLGVDELNEASTGDGAAPGFVVAARGNDAIIFNKDGELVWGYTFSDVGNQGIFAANMSWDGQYMVARDLGPFDAGSGGTFFRVGIDGSGAMSADAPGGDHHDFTVIPSGVAYLAKANAGECDAVYTASLDFTDGSPVFDTYDIFQYFNEVAMTGMELCHCNRIHYSGDADTYTVSDRNKDVIAVFQADGTPVTSIGATPTGGWSQHIQAEGAGSEWRVQHGHHYYADDELLVFSNNSNGGSAMLHYTISGSNAALDWKYDAAGTSMTQGDVQVLPNGNFLVTASNAGTMHELGPSQNLIGSYTAGTGMGFGGGFGYVWHRPTLYGPPPGR